MAYGEKRDWFTRCLALGAAPSGPSPSPAIIGIAARLNCGYHASSPATRPRRALVYLHLAASQRTVRRTGVPFVAPPERSRAPSVSQNPNPIRWIRGPTTQRQPPKTQVGTPRLPRRRQDVLQSDNRHPNDTKDCYKLDTVDVIGNRVWQGSTVSDRRRVRQGSTGIDGQRPPLRGSTVGDRRYRARECDRVRRSAGRANF